MPSPLNLIGTKLEYYEVIGRSENDKFGCTRWICKCHCGKEFITNASCIQNGDRKSCGCQSYVDIPHKGQRQDPQLTSFKRVVNRYIQQSKHRKIEWRLEEDEAIKLFKSDCYYCGSPPFNEHNAYIRKSNKRCVTRNRAYAEKAWIKTNGIDRLDSSRGYISDNVVTCCSICNFAKNTLSEQEFYKWLERAYNHVKDRLL